MTGHWRKTPSRPVKFTPPNEGWSIQPVAPDGQTYEFDPRTASVIGPTSDASETATQLQHVDEQLHLSRQYPGRQPPPDPTNVIPFGRP
jgi:hypothetical protein